MRRRRRVDALLEGSTGGLQCVLDAVLLLLHLGLGRSADLDHRDAAGQLRQPLLQLLAVEVGVGRNEEKKLTARRQIWCRQRDWLGVSIVNFSTIRAGAVER